MNEPNKVHLVDFLDNDLPDNYADMIIADPPYFGTKGEFDFVWPSFDAYLVDVQKWVDECRRILRPSGVIFWWGSAKRIAYTQVLMDADLLLFNSLVWAKNECRTMRTDPHSLKCFAPVTERCLAYENVRPQDINQRAFDTGMAYADDIAELIEYLVGKLNEAGLTHDDVNEHTATKMASHWFARTSQWAIPTAQRWDQLRELFRGRGVELKTREDLVRWHDELAPGGPPPDIHRHFHMERLFTDVLNFSQESHITKNYDHPTKKPPHLTELLVLTTTRPGDRVVVPFAGSGTECAMAAKLGREFVGFEIDAKYAAMANKRCVPHLQQTRLF
jgi:site-specific DNA-methyltransferase (adenine-specific)